MAEYFFEWKALVDRSIVIEADNKKEAHEKWLSGDYGESDNNNEENINDTIEIDQEEYYADKHEKVKRGWG